MNRNVGMFGVALLILMLLIAVVLGFLAGPTSPLTWFLVVALIAVPFIHQKFSSRKYLAWKSEYNTGIQSIDQQHRKLLGLINQLQTAVDHSTGEEFEKETLNGLVDYTKTHFAYEEKLMEDNGYPELVAHRAEHEKMIAQVTSVLAEYEQSHDKSMQLAHDFLRDWLVNHINGTDQRYSDYLIGKGVR